jgi:hypothetical protein
MRPPFSYTKVTYTGYVAEFTCGTDQLPPHANKFSVTITPQPNSNRDPVTFVNRDVSTNNNDLKNDNRAILMAMIATIKDAYLQTKKVILKGARLTPPNYILLDSVTLKELEGPYLKTPIRGPKRPRSSANARTARARRR